jgi:hypothetical protein
LLEIKHPINKPDGGSFEKVGHVLLANTQNIEIELALSHVLEVVVHLLKRGGITGKCTSTTVPSNGNMQCHS